MEQPNWKKINRERKLARSASNILKEARKRDKARALKAKRKKEAGDGAE